MAGSKLRAVYGLISLEDLLVGAADTTANPVLYVNGYNGTGVDSATMQMSSAGIFEIVSDDLTIEATNTFKVSDAGGVSDILTIETSNQRTEFTGLVGIGMTPNLGHSEVLTLGGAITIGNSDYNDIRGTIRFVNNEFQGRDNTGWVILSGGEATTPGGSNGDIQFNNHEVFDGDSNLFWDQPNQALGVGTNTPFVGSRAHIVGMLYMEGDINFNSISDAIQVGGVDVLHFADDTSNVILGYGSGVNMLPGGTNNTIVGSMSALNLEDGFSNVIIGQSAGSTLTDGFENILIGTGVDTSHPGTSNYLNIGNTIYSTMNNGYVGIGVPAPVVELDVGTTGGIRIGTTTVEEAGVLRFDGTIFQGYDGTTWVDLGVEAAGAEGSVQFNLNDQLAGDANHFFWDHTNYRLGIGLGTPETNLHVLGTSRFEGLLNSYENTDVDIGVEDVDTVETSAAWACHWKYIVKRGTNVRTGVVFAVWNGSDEIEYTEMSTIDIGDTDSLSLECDISGGNVRLRARATTDNWLVRVQRMIV